MLLNDMIAEDIIVPLNDKNNKSVDVNMSYVQITKESDEYILKVNLKDSENEDYILVHLGCYSYCDSYICEKRPESTVDSKSNVSSTVYTTAFPSTYSGRFVNVHAQFSAAVTVNAATLFPLKSTAAFPSASNVIVILPGLNPSLSFSSTHVFLPFTEIGLGD